MSGWFRRRPIRVRITLAFLAAMALLLLASGAFIYERMQFALDRSIRDVPKGEEVEIAARRRHRNEALDELLAQLAVAYGVTVAVAGFVGYRMTRAALDPVESMQRQASAPRPPGSRVRLDVPETDDELSRLAQTLNTLLASTERAVERERRFIADASHELRTPLSLLKLHIDLALSRDRPQAELRYALERAGADTDRLIRLANNLLLIAQVDEGTLALARVRVDVHEALVEAAARVAEPARARGSAVHVSPGGDGTAVVVDPERLQQALTNLLDNALRHGDGDVKLSWRRSGDRAEIHVEDAGRGFAPEFVARAFDRFATTNESRTAGGAGLGLSIAQAIAEAHGGSARAVNGEHGADVSLSLPLAE